MLEVFKAHNCYQNRRIGLEIDRTLLIYVNGQNYVIKDVVVSLKSTSTTYDIPADAENAETERCRTWLICSKYLKLKIAYKEKKLAWNRQENPYTCQWLRFCRKICVFWSKKYQHHLWFPSRRWKCYFIGFILFRVIPLSKISRGQIQAYKIILFQKSCD